MDPLLHTDIKRPSNWLLRRGRPPRRVRIRRSSVVRHVSGQRTANLGTPGQPPARSKASRTNRTATRDPRQPVNRKMFRTANQPSVVMLDGSRVKHYDVPIASLWHSGDEKPNLPRTPHSPQCFVGRTSWAPQVFKAYLAAERAPRLLTLPLTYRRFNLQPMADKNLPRTLA